MAFFGNNAWATLAIYAVEQILLVGTLGTSLGHRLLGVAVVSARDGSRPGVLSATIRTLLLCLVLPGVIWAQDEPLHDRLAHTTVVRRHRR